MFSIRYKIFKNRFNAQFDIQYILNLQSLKQILYFIGCCEVIRFFNIMYKSINFATLIYNSLRTLKHFCLLFPIYIKWKYVIRLIPFRAGYYGIVNWQMTRNWTTELAGRGKIIISGYLETVAASATTVLNHCTQMLLGNVTLIKDLLVHIKIVRETYEQNFRP